MMNFHAMMLPFLLAILIYSTPAASSSADNRTAYDIINEDYDFPVGILPKGIVYYDLDRSTGKFAAHFNGNCAFSIQGSYQLSYKSAIKGRISKGKLTKLEGVQVKILFLWLNIVDVERDGDELNFSVGIASAGFGIENFLESPQCGCGFDCGNGGVSKLRVNPFGVSSY